MGWLPLNSNTYYCWKEKDIFNELISRTNETCLAAKRVVGNKYVVAKAAAIKQTVKALLLLGIENGEAV